MAKKTDEPSTELHSPSGLPIAPVYRPADAAVDYDADLGDPGSFPYTRGVQPTMYRGRLWTMRQYAGFGTAQETNARFRLLLDAGQTGLSVAFDLPTQMGIDSDSPRALGEVGRVGVAIDTVEDMHALLADIPLDRVSTSMTINATASILLAMYVVVAEERGVARDKIAGTIQNDILKEYIARGTYIYPPEPSLDLVTETFRFCAAEVPQWNPISISGYHIREADASARLRFHTQTGGVTHTAQQPLNNVVRVAVQTLAAVLGGTQSLHTNGYDEALGLPTAEAATLALRTQQVVAFESGAAQTADPLAGSYYVEHLTDELERRAEELLAAVDEMGGAAEAIARGFFQ